MAKSLMLGGGTLLALGCVTSFLSYRDAGDRGGGIYYLFYGLILAGGLIFLRGHSLWRAHERRRGGRR